MGVKVAGHAQPCDFRWFSRSPPCDGTGVYRDETRCFSPGRHRGRSVPSKTRSRPLVNLSHVFLAGPVNVNMRGAHADHLDSRPHLCASAVSVSERVKDDDASVVTPLSREICHDGYKAVT